MLRKRRAILMVTWLAVIALPLVILGLLTARQIGNTADALNAREHQTLLQTARLAARELFYVISQEEGELLRFLDLETPESLTESLATAEAAFPGVRCFALMDDGTLAYPLDGEESAAQAEPASGVDARRSWDAYVSSLGRANAVHVVRRRQREILGRIAGSDVARVHFASESPDLIASLLRLRTPAGQGVLGLCWDKTLIVKWGQAAAAHVVPEGYFLDAADADGKPLFRLTADGKAPGASDSGTGVSLAFETEARGFPWKITIAPVDPARLGRLITRQVYFYAAVMIFLCFLILGGAWLLVRLALKEMELGRLKTDFAANVSHELRTPLALIRASADTLATRQDLERAQIDRYLGIIRKESKRLSDLVNTVLEFARIGRKAGTYDLATADVAALLTDFLETYGPHVREQGFELHTRLPGGPLFARVDREALHLVLVNLLDNAVKFSGNQKSIAVTLDAHDGQARLRVRDLGIGIDPRDQKRIFDSFFRVEGEFVKKTRGTGIGLALAREIVHSHGGQITVESKPGKGSTFTVQLPAVPAPTDGQGRAADQSRTGNDQPPGE